jgi:hypothetical protein
MNAAEKVKELKPIIVIQNELINENNNSPYANWGNKLKWEYGTGFIRRVQRLFAVWRRPDGGGGIVKPFGRGDKPWQDHPFFGFGAIR